MRGRGMAVALLSGVLMTSGCSMRLLDRWDGKVVRAETVAAPTDAVWERLTEDLAGLGLMVAGVRSGERVVDFAWLTAPGDGRVYLSCTDGPVGSASLRPRVALVSMPDGGTRVEVSSVARATAGSACVSTGKFEEWMLAQLQVGAAGLAAAPAPAN